MESVERMSQFNPGFLSCIDYLLAAADYQDFVELMLDFKTGFESDEEEAEEPQAEEQK